MLMEPKCYERACVHFLGALQPDNSEMTEVWNCKAFPKGIPAEIAYGNNQHIKPLPDQKNDIIYEKSP